MSRGQRGRARAGSRQSLRRGQPTRDPKPHVLIVCEGEKTEPLYFDHFRVEKRLRKQLLNIVGGDKCGASPTSIVKYTKKMMIQAKKERLPYDHIWCVFDRDTHENIEAAFEQARSNRFHLAFSNPCFELWLLLHFQDQRADIERNRVVSQLRRQLPNYSKNEDLYDQLQDGQHDAIQRAKDLRKQHTDNEAIPPNPSTTVDTLVCFLRKSYP